MLNTYSLQVLVCYVTIRRPIRPRGDDKRTFRQPQQLLELDAEKLVARICRSMCCPILYFSKTSMTNYSRVNYHVHGRKRSQVHHTPIRCLTQRCSSACSINDGAAQRDQKPGHQLFSVEFEQSSCCGCLKVRLSSPRVSRHHAPAQDTCLPSQR